MNTAKRMSGIIGVVHLKAMLGDPAGRPIADVEREARRDAEALQRGGVDGIIVENFGSSPFVRGDATDPLPPHQVAAMALLAAGIKKESDVPVGVNCLRNDARAALGIAAAAQLDFIRVNVHTGAYLTDQGVIQGDAAHTLRYREFLAAQQVAICADVLVKHAAPLAPLAMEQAARECATRGHADAVIVSGNSTGGAVNVDELQQARAGVGDAASLLIGSGLSLDNVAQLVSIADGAIVGTAFKAAADIAAPVEAERVRTLCAACRQQGWYR